MKVLIVDDNPDDRKLLRYNLQRHGCETVIEARDGQEALELARAHRPDLIVSDAMMPRLDGFQFLRKAKTDKDLAAIPFVFHSATYTGLKDEELALRLGAEAFIPKPKEPDEFWADIAAILKSRAEGRRKVPSQEPLEEEGEYLKQYSGIVAAKLEEKVRELEESLAKQKEAEELWKRTFDAVPDLVAIIGPDHRILKANKAMAERLGLTPTACPGLACYRVVHGTEQPPPFCPHAKLLVDQGQHAAEIREERLQGVFQVTASPLFDAAGELLGSVHVARDITEHKRAEEAAAHMAQAERLEALGVLAGGIAHDFNNILGVITGNVELTRMRVPKDSREYEDLGQALLASNRAAELISQILTFCRERQAESRPVAPKLLVKEALKFLRATLPASIELRQQVASEAVVLADPSEIHRIVVNLCTNAALAMADQKGLLEVLLEDLNLQEPVPVRYPGLKGGCYVRLSVRDTGCGMTPEVKARMFEPFFTTRPEGEGTGMGLSVVHGIVKARGGIITVESEPGAGTVFEVLLPVLDQKAVVSESLDEEPPAGTERILLVDDEEVMINVISRLLEGLGYRVRAFTNSQEALAVFEKQPRAFDLVITDLTMPQMTGDVLARRIHLVRPDVPVILCTGYSRTMTPEKAAELGIDGLVLKPLSLGRIARAIRKVLDRH